MKKLYMLMVGLMIAIAANAADALYVVGEGIAGDPSSAVKLTPQSDGTFTYQASGWSKVSTSSATDWDGFNSGCLKATSTVQMVQDQTVSLGTGDSNMPLPAYTSTFTYTIAEDLKSVRIVGATPPPAGYQKIYLVGAVTSGGWSFNSTNELSTDDGNLYYRKNMNLNANTEFKVAGSGYNPNYGGVSNIALNTKVTLQKGDNPSNCKYTGSKTSGLTVSFNLTTGEFLISDNGEMVGDGTDKNPYEGWYFNVRGDYNGWQDNGVMPDAEGIAVQSDLALGTGNFDVKVWDGTSDIYYFNEGTPIPTNEWVTLKKTDESNKDCTVAGATAGSVYNVKFNVSNGQIYIESTTISYPEEFYIIGNVNGGVFNPTNGIKMTTGENGVYTAENVEFGGDSGTNYGYFSFCTQLGENDGDWGGLGTRYEATEKDAEPVLGEANKIQVAQGGDFAFKIEEGTYDLTVDLATMTMVITKVGDEPEIPVAYGIVGSMQGWSIDSPVAMEDEGSDMWVAHFDNLPVDSQFKIATIGKGWDDTFGADYNEEGQTGTEPVDVVLEEDMPAWAGSSHNWNITEALTDVTIYFYKADDVNWYINVEGTVASDEPLPETTEGTFNFPEIANNYSDWTADGTNTFVSLKDVKLIENGFSFVATGGTQVSNQPRLYKTAAGVVTLRVYNTNSYTITAPTGYYLQTITLNSTSTSTSASGIQKIEPNCGTMAYDQKVGTWTAGAKDSSVTFAVTGTIQYVNIDVTAKLIDTAVDEIVIDENAPVVYYNLQGVRVANPEKGIYIIRQGEKVTKILK